MGGLTTLLWTMARVGIYVQGDHVVIRTYLRTTRHRWSDIARFDDMAVQDVRRGTARRLTSRRIRCVRLHLTDGRVVPVTLVNSSLTALGSKPAQIAQRLEAVRPSGREPRSSRSRSPSGGRAGATVVAAWSRAHIDAEVQGEPLARREVG